MDFQYRCTVCDRAYAISPQLSTCPQCAQSQQAGQPLFGVLEVEVAGTVPANWTPEDLLPVPREFFPPVPVGDTPLWSPLLLRRKLGLPNLFIKDDGANPTFSFKDRASFLVSAFARQHGIETIALASTGNAGSSMAGIGAAAGQSVTLFLPCTAPPEKRIQALQYGAQLHLVDGSYDEAYDLSLEYTRRCGGLNRNTAYNPMTIEGKKTVALELVRDLGGAPDHLFVPVGDGCILGGVYKGFSDLYRLGITDKVPKIYGIQSEGSDALTRAYHSGVFTRQASRTIADSISVDVPRNGLHALTRLRQHGGEMHAVSDAAILHAQHHLAQATGLFTEPAGAAACAGLLLLSRRLEPDAVTVVLATGSGLKDSRTAATGVQTPDRVIKTIDDILQDQIPC